MKYVEVVIETPKGSNIKFDYDVLTGFFKAKKRLHAGLSFPFDFGFIANTKGEDGDPLDAIVIAEWNSFPGAMYECRIIGAIKAEQKDEKTSKNIRNDRYIAIPKCSLMFKKIKTLKDLPKDCIEELEFFFILYNKLDKTKFDILGDMDPKSASKTIDKYSAE